ncbi:MAG: universal stress protein [Planctomycetaceae bacterium]
MSWKPVETVIAPIDFSSSSRTCVLEALNMARRPDCVHVLHVIPRHGAVSRLAQTQVPSEEEQLKTSREYLSTWLSSNEIEGVRQDVVFGDPGTMIVEYADAAGADLIVIPSHGHHGWKRMLLGSVAERVVRHARCPVYVLRRPDAA